MKKKQSTTRMTRRQFIGRTAGLSGFLIVPPFVLGGRGYVAPAIRFIGTHGQIDIQRHKLVTTPESLREIKIGPGEKHVYYSDDHYKDWLQAIRNRTQPICDVETGHRSATVCNLGNIAYALKRPLQWDPAKERFVHDRKADHLPGRKMRRPWTVPL